MIAAPHGINGILVGRDISSTTITVDDPTAQQTLVGRLGSLTAGALNSVVIDATTLGAVMITGYATPEGPTPSVAGDITSTIIQVNGIAGSSFGGLSTIPVLGVSNNLTGSTISAPFGISVLGVNGSISTSTIDAENVLAPTQGILGLLSAGDIGNAGSTVVRAGIIGTLQTVGNAAQNLIGSITGSTIVASSGLSLFNPPVALFTLGVAGNLNNVNLDVPGRIVTFAVNGQVNNGSGSIAAGYALGSRIDNLAVGQWNSGNLTSSSVLFFSVVGNTAHGLVGSVGTPVGTPALFDLFGQTAGYGLFDFAASGDVQNSTFRLSVGSVYSFATQGFIDSHLLIGFRAPSLYDIATVTPTAANWNSSTQSIAFFSSTSFQRSEVVAPVLGVIMLNGVTGVGTNPAEVIDPTILSPVTFGVGYRQTSGAAGVVFVNGLLRHPGFVLGQFDYLGLNG